MGTAAIAILIKKENEIAAHFRVAGATSSETAQSLVDLGLDDSVRFKRLASRGVLREASAGRYFLDEAAWEARARLRTRMVIAAAIIGVAVGYLTMSLTANRAGG
jgi:hypothetical protein